MILIPDKSAMFGIILPTTFLRLWDNILHLGQFKQLSKFDCHPYDVEQRSTKTFFKGLQNM